MSNLKTPSSSRLVNNKHRLAMELLRHKEREIAYLKRTLTHVALICGNAEVHGIVRYTLANSLAETADERRLPEQWRMAPQE